MADLSPTQLQALKTNITVTRAGVVVADHAGDSRTLVQWYDLGSFLPIVNFYNSAASPQVLMWRRDISRLDIQRQLVVSEFIAATVGHQSFITGVLLSPEFVDATDANTRAQFSAAMTTMATSLANVTAIAKKPATYLEALYGATVQGAWISDVYGQSLTLDNVRDAKAS